MSGDPEFSRLVTVERIARGDVTQAIEATQEECAEIAARLHLEAVGSLSAKLVLKQSLQPSLYQVEGTAQASVTQICVISGDPFPAEVSATIRALFSTAVDVAEDMADESWDDVEPVIDGIDIGELAVQHISLNLDLYPRKPGAEFPAEYSADKPVSPFAVLSTLRKDE